MSNRKGRGRQSIWPNSASRLRLAPQLVNWQTFFSATWKTSNRNGRPRFDDPQQGPKRGDLQTPRCRPSGHLPKPRTMRQPSLGGVTLSPAYGDIPGCVGAQTTVRMFRSAR
jgi:hypothetical protein